MLQEKYVHNEILEIVGQVYMSERSGSFPDCDDHPFRRHRHKSTGSTEARQHSPIVSG